jgi:hypothetical protein
MQTPPEGINWIGTDSTSVWTSVGFEQRFYKLWFVATSRAKRLRISWTVRINP